MAEPSVNDKTTVNLVVLFVGISLIATIAGMVVLLVTNHDGVTALAPLGTAALAGLVALLANTKSIDVGGLQQLDQDNKASLDQSAAAAALHAQLTKPTGDYNPPEYSGDPAPVVGSLGTVEADPAGDGTPPERLV